MNWCAHLQDFEKTCVERKVLNARVVPYENKVAEKIEKKKMDKHPWDIAHKIMKEQEQARGDHRRYTFKGHSQAITQAALWNHTGT